MSGWYSTEILELESEDLLSWDGDLECGREDGRNGVSTSKPTLSWLELNASQAAPGSLSGGIDISASIEEEESLDRIKRSSTAAADGGVPSPG